LALQLRHLARQLFVLAPEAREFGPQLFDLVGQLQQAAARARVAFSRFGRGAVGCLLVRVNLLPQLDDGLARLVVAKQGVGLQRPQRGQTKRPRRSIGELHVQR